MITAVRESQPGGRLDPHVLPARPADREARRRGGRHVLHRVRRRQGALSQ